MTPLITQLIAYFIIIPIAPREDLLSMHGLVDFMIPSGQLAGRGLWWALAVATWPRHCPSLPLMLWYSPYPRMQDLQQLRCKLCPVRQSHSLRPLSHWRNLSTGHSPEITTRKKVRGWGEHPTLQWPLAALRTPAPFS